MKLTIFCRPTVSHLCQGVLHQLRLSLRTECDTGLHLTRKLEDLADLDYLPAGCDFEDLTDKLPRGADGMFLWARLMISSSSSPALISGNGSMTMYSRIVSLILNNAQTSKGLAKRVIIWLLYARRQLAPREMEEALIVGTGRQVIDEDKFSNVSDTV